MPCLWLVRNIAVKRNWVSDHLVQAGCEARWQHRRKRANAERQEIAAREMHSHEGLVERDDTGESSTTC